MRIPLPSGHPINLRQFLLRSGYASHFDVKGNRLSFVRRIAGTDYPRLHLYIAKEISGQSYFTLHLDQKQPSYRGAPAHNAEYGGPLVTEEGERLYRLLQQATVPKPEAEPRRTGFWPWSRGSNDR